MAKKADFKESLGLIIEEDKKVDKELNIEDVDEQETSDSPFVLEKKKKKKNTKKSFPLYMEEDKVNELDKLCNKTGHTRNELINLMIDYSLKNLKIK